MEWREAALPQARAALDTGGSVLVLKGPGKLNEEVVKLLQRNDQHVIVAELAEGSLCTRLDDSRFLIDGSRESYRQLLSAAADSSLCLIIHALTCEQPSELD